MPAHALLVSVNVGRPADAEWAGKLRRTAIDKRPVAGNVMARSLGLDGDTQVDRKHHGGADRAVYVYALEDLRHWASELGRDLRPGQFGENLTTLGVDVTGARIGERWRIGSAVLEVRAPRIPCVVFQNFLGEPHWVKRFTEYGAAGAYCSVVEEGELSIGEPVTVVHRPQHDVTLLDAFRALTGDVEQAARLLDIPELADHVVADLHKRLRRPQPA